MMGSVIGLGEPFSDYSQVKIVRFDPSYVEDALAVFDKGLGQGYVSHEELMKYTDDGVSRLLLPRTHIAYAAVLFDGTVVGVATADHVRAAANLWSFIPVAARERFKRLVQEVEYTDVALLHSVAVSPEHQGKGVASALVREIVSTLQRQGVETVVSVGWTDEEGCHIQGALERGGFLPCGDILGYWTEDSIEKKYQCPSCGFPCNCTARIFGLFSVSILEVN